MALAAPPNRKKGRGRPWIRARLQSDRKLYTSWSAFFDLIADAQRIFERGHGFSRAAESQEGPGPAVDQGTTSVRSETVHLLVCLLRPDRGRAAHFRERAWL